MPDMDHSQQDLDALRRVVADLTGRVYKLERALELTVGAPVVPTAAPVPAKPAVTAAPPPSMAEARSTPPQPAPKPVPDVQPVPQPDLESRIGSHWLNRIGITAVLVGVSYFLKYAFDNNWIGPAGRVSIGLLAGIVVVVWSERFRSRNYAAFSYSLKAVGIGVLYLSLWAAFHVYSLVPSGIAFTAMLLVTAATAAMALTQDAEILGAFALIGGFATPILLSTGVNREFALFSYVTILDLATLAMLVFRPWRRLVILSFAGTLLLYIGWYSDFYRRNELDLTLAFATLFFAIFAIIPLASRQPKENGSRFQSILIGLALVNAAVYFLEVYAMVSEISKTEAAWFALALAAVYIVLSRQTGDRVGDPLIAQKLRLLHLALAAGFITVAIPIRLDQHWITIGWFVEAAILLWVANRIHAELLNGFALLALALGVARLLFFDDFYSTQLIFNARMATFAVAIAVLALVAWFASKRDDDAAKNVGAVAVVALNVLALVALTREVTDYYQRQMNATLYGFPGAVHHWSDWRAHQIIRDFAYSALWMIYGAGLMVVGFWRGSAFVRWQALILIAATTAKVFIYDVSQLDTGYRILSFVGLGVMLLAVSFAYQRDWLKLSNRKQPVGHSKGTA
jgi:uncharacterized membrane protein